MPHDTSISLETVRELVGRLVEMTTTAFVLWKVEDVDDPDSYRMIYSNVDEPVPEGPHDVRSATAEAYANTMRDGESRVLPRIVRGDAEFPERVSSLTAHRVAEDVLGVVVEDITEEAARLSYLRRELDASDMERARTARELNDEIGQLLAAGAIQLRQLEAREDLDAGARDQVRSLVSFYEQLDGSIRRLSAGLHPVALEDVGLDVAVSDLCVRLTRNTDVEAHLHLASDAPILPAPIQLALYRIAQEALENVIRRAEARHVWVSTQYEGEQVTMTIEDDGRGLTHAAFARGLIGIRERADMAGGTVEISTRPAGGTAVVVTVPAN